MRGAQRLLPMPLDSPFQLAPFVLVATAILALLVRGRVFTAQAFARAPDRAIGLGLLDLLAGLGLTILGYQAFTVIALAAGLLGEGVSPLGRMLAVILSQVLGHGLPLLYLVARASFVPGGLKKIGLVPTRPVRDLLAGVGGFLCVLPLVLGVTMAATAVATWLGRPPDPLGHTLLPLLHHPESDARVKILLIVSAAGLAPFFEECIYRGLLQSALVEGFRGRRWPAILVTSAVFSVIHYNAVEPPALAALFVLAIAFGWLYERTGSLWPGILVHALFNAFNLAIALLLLAPPPPA